MAPSRKAVRLAAALTVTAIVMMPLAGCTPLAPSSSSGSPARRETRSASTTRPRSDNAGGGVYHTVEKGQITEANGLSNYDIGVGQKLWIPGVKRQLVVTPPGGREAADEEPGNAPDTKLAWPLAGRGRSSVTSPFGPRKSPGAGGSTFHKGIDIDGAREERVLSAAAGEVVYSGRMSGFGIVVMIDHGDRLITVYGHLSRALARLEENVSQGQTIGYVGSTGAATGSHLHFEVRHRGKSVDPLDFLP